MTDFEIEEFQKCRDSIQYFAEKYILVDGKPIVLNTFQKEAIEDFYQKRVFAKIGNRIEGKTTIAGIILLHQSIFRPRRVSVVFGPNIQQTNEILWKILLMNSCLPDFLREKFSETKKTSLVFNNQSRILSLGKNFYLAKGMGISNVYIDESEFVPTLIEGFTSVVYPVITPSKSSSMFAFTSTRTQDLFRQHDDSRNKYAQ